MKAYREKLIKELHEIKNGSNNKIEELADKIIADIKYYNGQEYVKAFNECPMCINCPDGCPFDNYSDCISKDGYSLGKEELTQMQQKSQEIFLNT